MLELFLGADVVDLLFGNDMGDICVAELKKAGDIVGRRVREAAQKGHRLDPYAVDEDILNINLMVSPSTDDVVGIEHGEPEDEEHSEGEEEVRHCHKIEQRAETECQSEHKGYRRNLGEGNQGKERHLLEGHVSDDDAVGPQSPDEQEGECERKPHPVADELPMEGTCIKEDVDHSQHDKRGHKRHDHVEEEDDPCAEI